MCSLPQVPSSSMYSWNRPSTDLTRAAKAGSCSRIRSSYSETSCITATALW